MLNLAFVLYRYFPHGGLQRDFLRIAQEAIARGHHVTVFTTAWEGERPAGWEIRFLKTRGWTNHRRLQNFGRDVQAAVAGAGYDGVVGFNKLPGLDVYYAADPCYVDRVARSKGPFYRLTGRYRSFAGLEAAVFAPPSHTRILMIAEPEVARFQACHQTPADRFVLLPPGISRDRLAGADAAEVGRRTRRQLGFAEQDLLLLQVGSAFRTKGVDRSLRALASLPAPLRERARLVIAGRGQAAPFERLAGQLGVREQVVFLGPRDDVPALLLAADLLIHPAYTENTGTVLIEAMCAGLPVLTTANCGYAGHVLAAAGGQVVSLPFQQAELDRQLAAMLADEHLRRYGEQGLAYVQRTDVYSMPEQAVDAIEAQLCGRSK